MISAHKQRISDRLQSLCEGVRKGKKLRDNPKRKEQWETIQKQIQEGSVANLVFMTAGSFDDREVEAKCIAEVWKANCQAAGIGAGWLAFLFWRFFLPILIQLAKDWLEEMSEEMSQVTISGVAMGSAEGGT